MREDWRNILRVIALRVVESCADYLTATYLLCYIAKRDPADRTAALTGVVIASVIAVGTTLGRRGASPTGSAADVSIWPAASWRSRSASRCTCWPTPASHS